MKINEKGIYMKRIVKIIAVAAVIGLCSGCGDSSAEIDLSAVYSGIAPMAGDTLVEMNDNYISNYYGIDVADLQNYVFAQSDDPTSAETIIIFKCQDKEKRNSYKTAIENAVNQKYDELSNYNQPEEAKLVKASKINTKGDVVYLVISDNAKDMNKIIKDSIS